MTDEFAPLVRVGMVSNSPPTGKSATGFLNPVLGGLYGLKLSPRAQARLDDPMKDAKYKLFQLDVPFVF